MDDVLDAGAVAWAARQVLLSAAKPMPNPPETLQRRLAMRYLVMADLSEA
jgi:hypothetical protein